MQLLLLTRSIYPLHGYGGMERHCYDWILAMESRGCRVHVVTMTPPFPEGLSRFGTNVSFYFVPGTPARKIVARVTSYPRWVRRLNHFLRGLLASAKIDAIYAHGLAAAGCDGLPVPMYYNPHGMEEFKTTGFKYAAYAPFRALSRRGAAIAHRVIATDRALEPEIRRYLGVDDARIARIPNAVRLDPGPSSAMRVALHGDPLLLAVGRLEPNKGFHVLIEALSRAKALPTGWRLVIAGAGSQERRLKELVLRCGLRTNVSLLGPMDEPDLNALFQRADIFVNPTLYEGSSIVTLEAMKHSLPVVASRTGGIPDKVFPGRNGWLAAPGDSAALARALEEACAARNQWKEMGYCSAKIVREQFSWDAAADRFLALFQGSS